MFSPFFRAWCAHGWRAPAPSPRSVRWERPLVSHAVPATAVPAGLTLPAAGEEAAMRRWRAFRDGALADYPERIVDHRAERAEALARLAEISRS